MLVQSSPPPSIHPAPTHPQAFLLGYSRSLLNELNISSTVVPDMQLATAVAAVSSRAATATAIGPLPVVTPTLLAAAGSQPLMASAQSMQAAAIGVQQGGQQLMSIGSGAVSPFDVRLEWKHSCK